MCLFTFLWKRKWALNFTLEGPQTFSSGKGHFYEERINLCRDFAKGITAKAKPVQASKKYMCFYNFICVYNSTHGEMVYLPTLQNYCTGYIDEVQGVHLCVCSVWTHIQTIISLQSFYNTLVHFGILVGFVLAGPYLFTF